MQGQTGRCHGLLVGIAVDRVAEHRVGEGGQVHPHLVGAAGVQFRLHQGDIAQQLHWLEVGERRLAFPWSQCRAPRGRPGPADVGAHGAGLAQLATGEGEVAAGHGVEAELPLQGCDYLMPPGQHHDTGGVPIQPVDNEHRSPLAGSAVQLAGGANEQRVAVLVAAGVDQHSPRLDHHQKVLVQVQDIQAWSQRGRPAAGQVGVVDDDIGGTH